MILLDKHDLQVIVSLRRNADFIQFIEILNRSANAIAIGNAKIRSEVSTRWNQGRRQELLDILNKIEKADEDFKQYRKEARKFVE